ncbi:TonB-dependent receptor family protein [Marivita sp. S0852]|uniref:TonB-dependent receptor family protein n=1 Tax=Marivita sp. S0852 TaxID=3373893 RepID=UPI0039819FBD
MTDAPHHIRTLGGAVLTGLAMLYGGTALAQSAQPGAEGYFDLGTLILDPAALADRLRERLRNNGAASTVVGADQYDQIATPTVADALATEPGVVVQEFFGSNDQPRIQIRGSGLQQSPTERGLLVLQNGMPVNRADGSYIVGLAAPGSAEAIEVWRGAAANRLGASVLGGAVNFISPTASSDPATRLRFSGGSFGQMGVSGQTAFQGETAGALLQFELNQKDGFRDINNESLRNSIGGNVELRHSDTATTQLFLSYTDLAFDVAGPLTKDALGSDPSQTHPGPTIVGPGMIANPGPNVFRDLPRREATQLLAGTRTIFDIDHHRFDFGLSVSATDDSFRFPIAAGERATDGWDTNLSARYAFRPESVNGLPMVEATLNYSYGEADRAYFHNTSGKRGPQFGENELEASTLSMHLGANLPLNVVLVLSPSLSYTYAERNNTDVWGFATRPTIGFSPMSPDMALPNGTVPTVSNSYSQEYSGWSPRLALTFTPNDQQTAWIAYSRGFEPPTHDDLLATTGGTPFSGPGRPNAGMPTSGSAAFTTTDLKAQEADTLEIGWRGQTARGLAWDVTAYHSQIRNEILSLRDATAAPRGSINAGKTVHNGIEAGLSGPISDRLSARLAWTYQDFRFDDDPLRGNNRLGGAPEHLITASLAWDATDQLTLFGSTRWVPVKTPVDNMNTLYADPYFVADLHASYRLTDTVNIYAGITNVFDEAYASSTLVVDQARADQAAFIPGEGRTFTLSTSFEF